MTLARPDLTPSKEKYINIPKWILESNKDLFDKYSNMDLGDIPQRANNELLESGYFGQSGLSKNYLEKIKKFLQKPIEQFTSDQDLYTLHDEYLLQSTIRKMRESNFGVSALEDLMKLLSIKMSLVNVLSELEEYLKSDFVVYISRRPAGWTGKDDIPYYSISNKAVELKSKIDSLNEILKTSGDSIAIDETHLNNATQEIAKKGVKYFRSKCEKTSNHNLICTEDQEKGWYPSMMANAEMTGEDVSNVKTSAEYINEAKTRLIQNIKNRVATLNSTPHNNHETRSVFVNKLLKSFEIWGFTIESDYKSSKRKITLSLIEEIKNWDTNNSITNEWEIISDSLIAEEILSIIGKSEDEDEYDTLKANISDLNDSQNTLDDTEKWLNHISSYVLPKISDLLANAKKLPDDVKESLNTDLENLKNFAYGRSEEALAALTHIQAQIKTIERLALVEMDMTRGTKSQPLS